jgi:hypothetical protein
VFLLQDVVLHISTWIIFVFASRQADKLRKLHCAKHLEDWASNIQRFEGEAAVKAGNSDFIALTSSVRDDPEYE